MLDRANDPAAPPQADADTKPRPVEFRGGGFVPRAGRYSGWIALLLAPLAHAVDSFVVPNSSEAVEGDSNNTIPFSSEGGNTRYQQVYLDSDIPPGPFTIYGIAFRPNGIGPVQPNFSFQIPEIDIFLVPTDENTNLSTDFEFNVGIGYQLVASGPLTLTSAASGPGMKPSH